MSSRRVLIVGATSAVATEVARLYAAHGDRIYLLARNEERLAQLVEELGSNVAGHETGDLNEFDQNERRVTQAIEALGGLDIALVAHGLLGEQVRSENEFGHAREILETNLLSAVSLLAPIANYMEAQSRGHVGAITSVAGERGRPRNYTYGAAKGGLSRYLQGMRSRLYHQGVHVLNVKLGPTDTPMAADHPKHALFGEKRAVARGIVRALDGRKHVVYLPTVWAGVMAIVRALPEFIFQRFGFLAGR
ncbi:MAG: decaprenylphospho-beta-D-erythro-pentofuranosid-2-ulose 2-reductase [Planctomycetota bacterium]|jgi:decaprenylphospho-beta-D-erythro-pentofuranosid-2-ulose 2-reductase